MSEAQTIKVFANLRDLEIFDVEGELCGVADDVAFDGAPGGALTIKALLVGPGAYQHRMARPLARMLQRMVGASVVEVPWSAVAQVTSRITLNRRAEELGLGAVERRLQPALKRLPLA